MPFCPLHLSFTWVEPNTTVNMITFVIVMPTGVGYNKFKLNVVESTQLEMTVEWPKAMRSPDEMHRKWIKNASDEGSASTTSGSVADHLRKVAMENALKSYRSLSTTKIYGHFLSKPIPFPVRKDIGKPTNMNIDGACVVYVTLRGVSSDYADESNNVAFEEV